MTFVKFDHDFIGSDAKENRRQTAAQESNFEVERRGCHQSLRIHVPAGQKSTTNTSICRCPTTRRLRMTSCRTTENGGRIDVRGYSYNERSMLSLGVVDPISKSVTKSLTWGEEGGGSKKTTVERHKQIEIRAIVSPVPYSSRAQDVRGRLMYRRVIDNKSNSGAGFDPLADLYHAKGASPFQSGSRWQFASTAASEGGSRPMRFR
jgi:vanillate/3-O-methylgallate O-demethylase